MKLWQSVRMAFQTLLAKKGRSFLTMLGTVIGVTAVIALVSVTKAQNQADLEMIYGMMENLVTVNFYSYEYNGAPPNAEIARELKEYLDTDLAAYTDGFTPNAQEYEMRVRWGEREVLIRPLYYGNEQFSEAMGFELDRGRDLSVMDVERANNVVVLGTLAAEKIFSFEDPIGQELEIAGIPFTVIGVYRQSQSQDYYGDETYYYEYSQDNMILIPHTASRVINRSMVIQDYVIKVPDPNTGLELVKLLKNFFATMLTFPDYETMSQSEIDYMYQNNLVNGYVNVYARFTGLETLNESMDAQTRTLSLIAAISLLVGGIGIMNIMLVTVTERTREIGVRKAIGAPRRTIVTQFLIEATVLSGSGGILGVLVGFVVTVYWGKIQYDIIASPDLPITALAFGGSLLMGIIFGIYPAFKAASLQPVDALRTE